MIKSRASCVNCGLANATNPYKECRKSLHIVVSRNSGHVDTRQKGGRVGDDRYFLMVRMRDKNTSAGAGFAHFDRRDSFKLTEGCRMKNRKSQVTDVTWRTATLSRRDRDNSGGMRSFVFRLHTERSTARSWGARGAPSHLALPASHLASCRALYEDV